MEDTVQLKKEQREAAMAARRAISPQKRALLSKQICVRIALLQEFACAKTLFFYRAVGAEADPAQAAMQALALKKRVAYPYCHTRGQMRAYDLRGCDAWVRDCYGLLAPDPSVASMVPPEEIDLVIIPCTAFDSAGRRCGMGGGVYDRFLPHCVRAFKLGIAFDQQRLPQVVAGIHDVSLDAVVTPSRLWRF